MTALWNDILAHKTIVALVAFWIGSNIATALPSASQQSGQFYKFFFAFVHGVIGGLPRIFPVLRLPNDASRDTPTFFGNGSTTTTSTTEVKK